MGLRCGSLIFPLEHPVFKNARDVFFGESIVFHVFSLFGGPLEQVQVNPVWKWIWKKILGFDMIGLCLSIDVEP